MLTLAQIIEIRLEKARTVGAAHGWYGLGRWPIELAFAYFVYFAVQIPFRG